VKFASLKLRLIVKPEPGPEAVLSCQDVYWLHLLFNTQPTA